jgi:CheY-like chemotaxis protein
MEQVSVLIVEDEAIVALDTQELLQGLGYGVCGIASSGEEAVEKAAAVRPDLVLMDIWLKGEMDGIEAADRIIPLSIPVIYATAHSDPTTLERAMRTRPSGYVLKPFGETELRVAIEVALSRGRAEPGLRHRERRNCH